MIVSKQDGERFFALRNRIFRLIEAIDEGYHKSYEGAMDVIISFPNYYESDPGSEIANVILSACWSIELHCYLLIDGRHKTYAGDTLSKCLDAMELDISEWETIYSDELSKQNGDP